MQIREVTIQNFRGIRSFTWRPITALVCIIGAGDSCKSTILDAIEMTLGTRWLAITDVDFTDGDTSKAIEIVVTVGQLPREVLRENRMGMHLRGWRPESGVCDEPDREDEPVVSVRLTIDSSLEPAWELVTDRHEPRTLSPRDRALFGLVRLGGDADRHLTWGQGSALARLSTDKDQAAPLLADAYRKARDILKAGTLPSLDAVATRVRNQAIKLGAYAAGDYSAGLDTQRSSMSLGTIAMHHDGVPLRLSGLGTRRLVALAIQQMSIPDGAVVLIDELEHGLEPHRIRHTLKVLRDALSASGNVGQVMLTTHASTAVVELSCEQLSVCHRAGGDVEVKSPSSRLQPMVRRMPEAFLSRRVLVCEGKTEVGLLRGLRDFWASRHEDEPPEARGTVAADGNGHEAVATACDLATLGYDVALLRDSDVPLSADESQRLLDHRIRVFEWEGGLCTEERLLLDMSTVGVQQMLSICFEYFGEASVLDSIRSNLGTKEKLVGDFGSWQIQGKGDVELRRAIGLSAKKKDWFKLVDRGERLGRLLAAELADGSISSTGKTLAATEAWAYGR